MDDIWLRISDNLLGRVSGPMKFRLVMQPAVAIAYATYAGLKDARAGKPPYLWTVATDPGQRIDLVRDGWKGIGKVFILALVLDIVYQIVVARFVYPGEAVLVAIVLAIIPYALARGLANRLASVTRRPRRRPRAGS